MSAIEPLAAPDPDEAAADLAARELVAEVLLQLVTEEIVMRPQIPRALAALGICTPDLEEARTRRRRWGWRGPRLRGLVKVPPSEDPRYSNASRQTRRYAKANPGEGMKRCALCREVNPVETFALKSETSGNPTRRSYCPPCWKEKQRERYLSVKKAKLLNEVGLTFVVVEGDEVAGLACLVCLQPIKAGDTVHGRAALRHEGCAA